MYSPPVVCSRAPDMPERAANPKRSALHSKVCWVLLSFQLSLKFAVTGDFLLFAITPPMTFQSSQQTLFTSEGIFLPSVQYSRGIKGRLTAGTQCKRFNVLINVNHSGVVSIPFFCFL